jgi:hypothetical protein
MINEKVFNSYFEQKNKMPKINIQTMKYENNLNIKVTEIEDSGDNNNRNDNIKNEKKFLNPEEIQEINDKLLEEFNKEIVIGEQVVQSYKDNKIGETDGRKKIEELELETRDSLSYEYEFSDNKEISEKNYDIDKLIEQKNNLLQVILGNFFNGVLVKEKLSIRNGKIFEYRRQYPCGLKYFKLRVIENLQEATANLNDKQLDILEFCMNKITEIEPQKFNVNIKPLFFVTKENDEEYKINKLTKIEIDRGGSIITNLYRHNSFERIFTTKSILHYQKEIEQGIIDYIAQLDNIIETLNKEIEEIKTKGTDYLAFAELTKQEGND